MSKPRVKVPKVGKGVQNKNHITTPLINKPSIDFRYLHHAKYCLKKAGWDLKKDKKSFDSFFDELQEFVLNFSECETISDARKQYSSHINSSSKDLIKLPKVKEMIMRMPQEMRDTVFKEITHFHLKRGGFGGPVVIGFMMGSVFNVIALDPKHEFNS